jgi:hypothetical protein
MYQHLPLQEPLKFTQIGIFGLKTNPLATLLLIAFIRKETKAAGNAISDNAIELKC